MIARLILIAATACALASCSLLHGKSSQKIARALGIVQDVSLAPLPDAPAQYKEALLLLQEEKFEPALKVFDDFLQQDPTSHYSQVANYNSGRALEGLSRWTEAAERYRAVTVACEGIAPKLQALALYRLSFTSEALADDAATVAVLHDLVNRSESLPKEVANAELPARLASAYARVGSFDEAVSFYKKAEVGIAQLRRSAGPGGTPEWLPRTLYFMGSMSLRRVSWDDFEAALRPLARGQAYLLQAAEVGVAPWSERASQDLIATYRELWNTLATAPRPDTSDALVSVRRFQRRQWDLAGLVLENLQELRARFLPNKDSGQATKDIEAFSQGLQKEIAKLLVQRPAGEGATPESVARKAALRGSVISPDGSLERQFKKGARATLPATHLPDKTEGAISGTVVPSADENPTAASKETERIQVVRPKEDPNL
jgi:tetratricopeptide (TPR) repeat protein